MNHSILPMFSSLIAVSAILSLPMVFAAPPVIDDERILNELTKETGAAVGKEGVASADALAKALKDAKGEIKKLDLALPENPLPPKGGDYESLSQAVYLVGSVYKCGKCDNWHQGSTATAWSLSGDGLMVTNAHVFRNGKGAAMGVINREGKCYPVTELLAFDEAADVAVFRVGGKDLPSLRVGEASDVGVSLSIISNPSGNLFVRTEGTVSRYSLRPGMVKDSKAKVTWMEVTADYAVGSSGGPVFNEAGEVVGMVSSTRSIHTGGSGQKAGQKGDLQMVIKSCVPVSAIRALFAK